MSDKPSEPEDEKEAERRFNETVGNLLRTPHKPHTGGKNAKEGRSPKAPPR